VSAEVTAILREVGQDEAELRNLIASLAGIAGQAVTVIARRLADANGEVQEDLSGRIAELRTKVLVECATALRELRPATLDLPATETPAPAAVRERRSGLERRLGRDRRHRPPGNPSEKINLRLFGERRRQVVDRRSGVDRRR
jgi:hypothetical protein